MTIWAIVPVKPLKRAKSRLSNVLSQDEHAALCRELLGHTLDVLASVDGIERTLVVSRDSSALAMAREHGARTVTERAKGRLNRALIRATVVARGYGVSGVLILPADLPLIREEDIRKLLDLATSPPVVVIAPDRRGKGTNALLSSPPGLIQYEFGRDSFNKHLADAHASGARVEICELDSFGLDLDGPDDLELLRARGSLSEVRRKE